MAKQYPRPSAGIAATLATLTAPLLIWALHFTVVYGSHTLVCVLRSSSGTAVVVILLATLLAVLALFANARYLARVTDVFTRKVSYTLNVLAAFAIAAAALGAFFVAGCNFGAT